VIRLQVVLLPITTSAEVQEERRCEVRRSASRFALLYIFSTRCMRLSFDAVSAKALASQKSLGAGYVGYLSTVVSAGQYCCYSFDSNLPTIEKRSSDS
jgi:hypothetical protein